MWYVYIDIVWLTLKWAHTVYPWPNEYCGLYVLFLLTHGFSLPFLGPAEMNPPRTVTPNGSGDTPRPRNKNWEMIMIIILLLAVLGYVLLFWSKDNDFSIFYETLLNNVLYIHTKE